MSQSTPLRTTLTVIMDVLIAVAIALTLRLVVEFFGGIAAQGWAQAVVALTNPITLPFGLQDINTPYGGIFDVDAAMTVVMVLLAEWILSVVRSRA